MASVVTPETKPASQDNSANAEFFNNLETEIRSDKLGRFSEFLAHSHMPPLEFVSEFITQYRAYQNKLYENPEFTQELRSVYPIEVNDGTTYSARLLNRKFLDKAPPLFVTPPLGVGDFGYWEMRLYSLATALEVPIISVSGEGHSYSVKRPNLLALTFPQISSNMHEVLDKFSDISNLDINFSTICCYGESRGGMVGLEMATTTHTGRQIDTVIAVGACGHEKPTLENLIRTTHQFLAREPLALIRHLRKDIDPRQRAYTIARLARTAIIGPKAIPAIVMTGLNVLQAPLCDIKNRLSESGTDYHMLFFEEDSTSNPRSWIEDFKDHPNFHFALYPGGHIDGILSPTPVIEAWKILYRKYGKNRQEFNRKIL